MIRFKTHISTLCFTLWIIACVCPYDTANLNCNFCCSPVSSRTRAFKFFLLRHVQAPCGIWTRAAVYSYMSGNGAAGWAMRELLVSLVFSTCRHIRAFATVIIYTIKQKFLEKTLWLFMVSNPNLQVHGPTLWPLYHAIPWTIPNNTITIFYRQKFICFRQTRFDPTRDMKENRRNIWNNSHNFKLNL